VVDRRSFIKIAGAGVATAACGGAISGTSSAPDRAFEHGLPLQELQYGQISFQPGIHQTQLEETHSVLMSLSEDSLLRPFRRRVGLPAPGVELGGWYSSDECGPSTFGQWISALARYYSITRNEATGAKIDRLVRAYAETIDSTGRFFKQYPWSAYTYDKLVCGLVDAHQLAHDPAALKVLARTTDAVIPYLPAKPITCVRDSCDEAEGFHSYTLPENQFIAWQCGGDARHLELAKRYLHHAFFNPLARGEDVLGGGHAYGHALALSSAAKAYLVLGEARHLQAAKNGLAFVEAQSYATGGWGPDETFLPHPKLPAGNSPVSRNLAESLANTRNSFETPDGAYAHFKLTRYLLRITRESSYGDSMERVMYNTVLGVKDMQSDGRAFYYADYHSLGRKIYASDRPDAEYGGRWHCCSGTLPQIAADYRISTYFKDEDGVFVNLYIPSTLRWEQYGAQMSLTQSGQYPLNDGVSLEITASKPVNSVIRLRIPAWAEAPSIRINGKKIAKTVESGTFATISREWNSGDRIDLELPRRLELKSVDAQHPDTVALVCGPVVLFAISDDTPKVTRAQLLAARQQGQGSAEWHVSTDGGRLRLIPFWAIKDETYFTYLTA
jgi:uncharacterized protein